MDKYKIRITAQAKAHLQEIRDQIKQLENMIIKDDQ